MNKLWIKKLIAFVLFTGFFFVIQVFNYLYIDENPIYPKTRMGRDMIISVIFGLSVIFIFPLMNDASKKAFGKSDKS